MPTNYSEVTQQLDRYRREIASIRARMREVQRRVTPEPISDYRFLTCEGSVALSELFGGQANLYVVHNMGVGCAYCTLWADGYNGVYPHLKRRASFVVVSPDSPEIQQAFARKRGWRFPMVSHRGTSFAADMGYQNAQGELRPGLSVFGLDAGRLVRVSDARSEPYDDFCVVWHLLDLLPEGAAAWRPRIRYTEAADSP